MIKIDPKAESPLCPVKFFVSKKRAEDAIKELAPHLEACAKWLKTGTWISWYVKVAYRGYLREGGEIY